MISKNAEMRRVSYAWGWEFQRFLEAQCLFDSSRTKVGSSRGVVDYGGRNGIVNTDRPDGVVLGPVNNLNGVADR